MPVLAPGCAGAIGLGDYVEGAAIVFLFSLAEWLEVRCISKARSALTAVLQLQPETAVLIQLPAAEQDTNSTKVASMPVTTKEVPVQDVSMHSLLAGAACKVQHLLS